MSAFEEEQKHREIDLEIIDLDAQQTAGAGPEPRGKEWLPSSHKLTGLHLLTKRPVQFTGLTVIFLVGMTVLLILSGVGSFFTRGQVHDVPSSRSLTKSGSSFIQSTVPPGQENVLACLEDAAWSPDSKQVAILGYNQDCPQNRPEPGLVNFYDARSGKLLTQLHPNGAVLQALHKRFLQEQGTPIIYYQNILWSPDMQSIALLFNGTFLLAQSAPTFVGILLVERDKKQQVLLWQEQKIDAPEFYLLWNMKSETPSIIPYDESDSLIGVNAAPASVYHWGTSSRLIAGETSNNSSSSPFQLSPIGNPDGNPSFTPWQFGEAARTTALGNISIPAPGIYTWATFFAAWSPDGHYLADAIRTGGILKVAGYALPKRQILSNIGADRLPVLNVRDKAFETVLLGLPASSTGSSGVSLSWRPDGRVLAAFDGTHITLYNCATGHTLATLAIPQKSGSSGLEGGNEGILRWSPDGLHLLLSTVEWGPISLWGPGQLPNV